MTQIFINKNWVVSYHDTRCLYSLDTRCPIRRTYTALVPGQFGEGSGRKTKCRLP